MKGATSGTRGTNGLNGANGASKHAPEKMRARELAVFVRCHELACAIPTRCVERLVLPEDTAELGPALLAVGNDRFASWDLGERLGLAPLTAAWVLMRLPSPSGIVPVALRTGTCLVVQALPPRIEVPPELFVFRRGVVESVFAGGTHVGGALYGLELNVQKLWTPTELDAALALLRTGNA